MSNLVFNNTFEVTQNFHDKIPVLSPVQVEAIKVNFYEQLLLFDKVVIKTCRLNSALLYLIQCIGINRVEELLEKGIIKFILWSPILTTLKEPLKDREVPPIVGGIIENDIEKNVDQALNYFQLNRDRKRIFKKIAIKNYLDFKALDITDNAAKIVIDAYENNNLVELGMPYRDKANLLKLDDRYKLISIADTVVETTALAKLNLKSFNNYKHCKLYETNISNIKKAYNVIDNTNKILTIENAPDLKELILTQKLDIENIMKIRYFGAAKYYRNWINGISDGVDAHKITEEYLNEATGKSNFFQSKGGKFIKTLSVFTVNKILADLVISSGVATMFSLGLSLLDTFWLDNIISRGSNPRMFIQEIKKEVGIKE